MIRLCPHPRRALATLIGLAALPSCGSEPPTPELEVRSGAAGGKGALLLDRIGDTTPSEWGDRDTYELRLNKVPTAPVTVWVTPSDRQEAYTSPSVVNISPDQWETPQQIEIVGKDDLLLDGDQPLVVELTARSDDPDFDELGASISTVVLDDEEQWFEIGSSGGSGTPGGPGSSGGTGVTGEDGTTHTLHLSLSVPHSQPLIATITVLDPSEARIAHIVHAADPSRTPEPGGDSVRLEPTNWPETWDIELTGVDDQVADGDTPYEVELTLRAPDDEEPLEVLTYQMLNLDGVCGNGIQEAREGCDDGNTTVEMCPYGAECCEVCGAECVLVEGDLAGQCGDGVISPEETCDPTAPDPCAEAPWASGASMCLDSCQRLDTSGCSERPPPRLHLGQGFVCAHDVGGQLRCAGNNLRDEATPDPTRTYEDAALGASYGCAIASDQRLVCWGDRETPTGRFRGSAVAVGGDQVCLIVGDAVQCPTGGFGGLSSGLPAGRTAIDLELSKGGEHLCVLLDDGTARL